MESDSDAGAGFLLERFRRVVSHFYDFRRMYDRILLHGFAVRCQLASDGSFVANEHQPDITREFLARKDGWPGLARAYGLERTTPSGLDHGLAYEALEARRIDVIDLYQLHNTRIEPILDDDLWATLEDLRSEGKIKHLGVALGPAIGWVEEGLESIRRRPICSLQTVYNIIEQEPGRTFVDESLRHGGQVGMISRVPHASDSLSGKVDRDTKFPAGDHRAHRNRDNMLDNFDKAETLSFLWEGTGRTMGQAAIAAILASPDFTTVLPTCVDVDEVAEYAAAADANTAATASASAAIVSKAKSLFMSTLRCAAHFTAGT